MRRDVGAVATQYLYKEIFLVSVSFEEEVMMIGRAICRTACTHSEGRHIAC